jgi:hypothetical protein
MSDDWDRPAQPPPPLFLGKKERDLVKQVNDELIEKVIGQQILYYPIDMQTTDFHDLYGEAIEKTFLPPVRIYALVEGDFVLYGKTYYEIIKLSDPRKLFGQVDHTFEISAICKRARRGTFDAT